MQNNLPDTSREFSEPVKETLSKAQKAIVDRVTLILETNPELNKKVSATFKKNFLDVVNDREKFDLLLEKLGNTEVGKLADIEAKFEKNQISKQEAIDESKAVIEQYTKAMLTALKGQINSLETA